MSDSVKCGRCQDWVHPTQPHICLPTEPAEPVKVPVTAEQIVRMLRAEAAACISGVAILLGKEAQEGFKLMELKLTAAADMIEAQEKRFAEHLEAWKANNAHHAARIAELEKHALALTKAPALSSDIIDSEDSMLVHNMETVLARK